MEAALNAGAPEQHGPQQQIDVEPLTEALEQQGSEQQVAADVAQDAQAPEQPRPEPQDGAAAALRPASAGEAQAQAAERLRPEQLGAAAADAEEQQGLGRPVALAAGAEAVAEQRRPEQQGATATEGQAQDLAQEHVINSWPECLAALNSYAWMLSTTRQGRQELSPGAAEGGLQQVQASIVDYLSADKRVAQVIENMLLQASVAPRGGSRQTARSGSEQESASDRSSSGHSSGSTGQTGESGSAASSWSSGASASTAAHASCSASSRGAAQSSSAARGGGGGGGGGSSSSGERSSANSGQTELADLPPCAFWPDRRCAVTTLMVYHVPTCFTQQDLIERWQLEGSYNFLYLRNSPERGDRLHIAIIDFVTGQQAIDFKQRWQGHVFEQSGSGQPLAIVASAVQGRDLNLMLVLDATPVPPVVPRGGQELSAARVREMVTFAKHGLLLRVV